MLTESEYIELKSRHDTFEAWRNGRLSYKTDEVPIVLKVSNDERSALEVYQFMQERPER